MDLKGSVAVVTGGASGLGEACVRRLTAAGAKAAIFDLNEEGGRRLAGELGGQAVFHKVDVTSEEEVAGGLKTCLDAFGALHLLINCAGMGIPAKVLGKEGPMPLNIFRKTIEVNLIGTFNVIRLAAEKMAANQPNRDGERGVVINTTSVAAFEGQIGQTAYSASKAGIVGITLPIAREFAELGIRVVTIAPGLFNTPMLAALPDKVKESLGKSVPFPPRLGEPREFAALATAIIENPVLNGETIRLDGALRMAPR